MIDCLGARNARQISRIELVIVVLLPGVPLAKLHSDGVGFGDRGSHPAGFRQFVVGALPRRPFGGHPPGYAMGWHKAVNMIRAKHVCSQTSCMCGGFVCTQWC